MERSSIDANVMTLMSSEPAHPTHHLDDFRPLALLVGAAMFMEQLDATIISPVIPQMAMDFGVQPLDLNLTMTVYLLCSLIFVPLSGVLADRLGSRPVFSCSLLLFVLSSALCALASEPLSLCIYRGMQGAAAAMTVPVGRNVLIHAVSRGKLVQALAWMVTPAMLGPMLGPPVGGLLGTYLSWQWVFWVNVPVGLVGLFAAWRIMPPLHAPAGVASMRVSGSWYRRCWHGGCWASSWLLKLANQCGYLRISLYCWV